MSLLESFTRVYQDKEYQHATTVRHQGKVIAFAMEKPSEERGHRRIFYTVLDLENKNAKPIDAENWLRNPCELSFTNEIARVGFGVAVPTAMPRVKLDGHEATQASPRRARRIGPLHVHDGTAHSGGRVSGCLG